jgi:hypothetical protein
MSRSRRTVVGLAVVATAGTALLVAPPATADRTVRLTTIAGPKPTEEVTPRTSGLLPGGLRPSASGPHLSASGSSAS